MTKNQLFRKIPPKNVVINILNVFGLKDLSSLPGLSELKSAGLIGSKLLISDDISQQNQNDTEENHFIEELNLEEK